MVKYTSDANLIKGAATAYKNWDNVAGMYKGLEDLSEAGREMAETAIKEKKEKEEKERQKIEDEKKKKDQLNKDWYDLSGEVYENAGSFMKDVEYKNTVNQLKELQLEWQKAQESGDAESMAAAKIKFNNIKSEIDDHKAFRELVADPKYGLSAAMDPSELKQGDNGEDKAFMLGFISEEYEVSRDKKTGKKIYTVNGISKTMKQIKDMAVVKDNIPYAAYAQTVDKYAKSKTLASRDNLEYDIRNNVVPQEINKLRAFLADDGFGNGETFLQLLNKPAAEGQKKSNRQLIEEEIIDTAFNGDGGGISDDEWNNFTQAIIDPKHSFWKGDEKAWQKSATQIATEQLANGVENAWNANPNNKDPKDGDIDSLTGFDKWLGSVGQGGRIGITPSKGKIGNWYNASSIRDIYNDMLTGKLSFEGFVYTFEDGVWTEEDNRPKIKGKDNPNFGNIETIGNQETFARNKLNQRNSVWTQAEIATEEEEVDRITGKKKVVKPKGEKYGDKDWDVSGTTNINIDTLVGDDINIVKNLNKQMPTGDLNPMGYKWSTDGSWSNEIFLLDANNNRISWKEILGADYNNTFRNTDRYGRKPRGKSIHLSTSSKSLNDKRNEMKLMLDILKRIKYTTSDGTATNLYDNFQPLGATSGSGTTGGTPRE